MVENPTKFPDIPKEKETAEWGIRYERVITTELIDENGHLNYLGFIKIFEEAQKSSQEERGISRDYLLKEFGIRLFAKKLNIEYVDEMKIGERAIVLTKVMPPRAKSATYHQAMFKEDGTLVATIDFVVVSVGEDGKSKILPDEVRSALTTL